MTLTNNQNEPESHTSSDKLKSTSLQVVFLLDITGSMSSQINGVKKMIEKFCEIERPGVQVHIWTFTENTKKCYVSRSPANLGAIELKNYVNEIKICCPPDQPTVKDAGGGDGPENVLAAVVSLLDSFDSNANLLCFLITDDTPHHKAFGRSQEAIAESVWLDENNHTEKDAFKLLNQVVESLNVTFVPVLYSTAIRAVWYQQAAVLSQGIVMCPKSTDSELLATGLGSILDTVQNLSISRQIDEVSIHRTAELCTGFSFLKIDQDEFEILEQDCERSADCFRDVQKNENLDDIKASLLGLMETTCDRFTGKKSAKRCRSVNPKVVSASVRVLAMSMLKIIGSKLRDDTKLNESVESLIQALEEKETDTSKHEIKLVNKWITDIEKLSLLKPQNIDSSIQPVQCVITLENSLEYLNSIEQIPQTDKDVSAWMEIILKLTMCRLIDVSFPLDVNGLPDFADAWSSILRNVELASVLTAHSATQLRDPETCMYLDPISRKNNSSAVLLAHPNDSVLTQIYTCLSALPTLQGLIQSYLVSGGLKVFPSILYGLQSSCLLHLLNSIKNRDTFTQSEWEVVRCLVWSLQNTLDTPASQVVNSLKDGKALNPSDNISKLLAGVIVFLHRTNIDNEEVKKILKYLYEEMSAGLIGSIYRKREKSLKETDHFLTDEDIIQCFLSSCLNDLNEFKPCSGLHEVEKLVNGIITLDDLNGMDKLYKLISECEPFKQNSHIFTTFCDLLKSDLSLDEKSNAVGYSSLFNKQELVQIFTESVILKKRTGRYNLDSEKQWNRSNESLDIPKIILRNIQDYFRSKFSEWNSARKEFARNDLLKKAANLSRDSVEECVKDLSNLSFELINQKYTLNRMDAIDVITLIGENESQLKTLGVALITGEWTAEPPCQLRRNIRFITEKYKAYPELEEMIRFNVLKSAVCSRVKPNRHGHHSMNIYPGLSGWTQEYHDERMKYIKNDSCLKVMKEHTENIGRIQRDLMDPSLNLGKNREKLAKFLINFVTEPSQLEIFKSLMDSIYKLEKLDDSELDQALEEKISEVSITRCKKKERKPLHRIRTFLSKL